MFRKGLSKGQGRQKCLLLCSGFEQVEVIDDVTGAVSGNSGGGSHFGAG